MASTDQNLRNEYAYHPPTGTKQYRHEMVRNLIDAAHSVIEELCPAGVELDQALVKLREAMMWANAGIACNPDPGQVGYLPELQLLDPDRLVEAPRLETPNTSRPVAP